MKISKSTGFKEEYCCSIVRIGETYPIEGRDRIVKTFVNGLSIVINKNDFKTGDIALYCSNESAIDKDFLYENSLFDNTQMNKDSDKKGYINKYGRIRIVKLGGVPSYGILFNPSTIANFLKEDIESITDFLNKNVGEDFDEINSRLFIKAYVPPIKPKSTRTTNKREKKLNKFKMLKDGSFKFHYDTKTLNKNIAEIGPDDLVYISNKLHGTSFICSNIETNIPTPLIKRLWRRYISKKHEYDTQYNIVYSSRNVIKNEYINPKASSFYTTDIWGYWANMIGKYIDKDICIYGEIVGYTTDGKSIQKGYDYDCKVGESKLMIYRATVRGKEICIPDIQALTRDLQNKIPNGKELIIDFPLLYTGSLKNLYPDLPVDGYWHERVLESLKVDKRFHMEELENMCINKVPVEGIVIRKASSPIPEAFKLKCFRFLSRESSNIDNGEVGMEMEEEL